MNTPPPTSPGLLRGPVAWSCILTLAFLTALPFFAPWHWSFDLVSHLRPHLALASVAGVGLSALLRHRSSAALAVGTLALNAVILLPDFVPVSPTPETAAKAEKLDVLMANVLTVNPDPQPLKQLIHRESPDVIGLLEVDDEWIDSLRYLRGRYPYHLEDARGDNFGIALFSRVPWQDARIEPLGGLGLNAIVASFMLEDRSVEILLAHPVPPAGRVYSAIRNQQLDELATLRATSPADEFLLIGDLNTTPWSPFFDRLVDRASLHVAARGHGYQPTWPVTLPAPLRIPIDHALLSDGLVAADHRVGPEIGSDHLPILTRVVLR